ncbi:MAG: M12 family metallo-peptidase, partial [Colwellia sp.]|nr:M12 family metallo-peptidase [Colwellia sp.]
MIKFWMLLGWLFIGYSLTLANLVLANQATSQFSYWQKSSLSAIAAAKNVMPAKSMSQTYATDVNQLRTILLKESDSVVISVPLPSGQLADFTLVASSIMADELAQAYPEIKTFTGVEVGNSNNSGRFDITPNGFHGMFYYDGELVFVEPEISLVAAPVFEGKHAKNRALKREQIQTDNYQSYLGKNTQLAERAKYQFHQPKLLPATSSDLLKSTDKTGKNSQSTAAKSAPSQSAIKTYRLAISTAAEYTQFHGGTVNSAMAEIATLVNRLNEVYQRDLAIKLELVANNNLLIFTDPATDPFDNTSDDGAINTQTIDNIIGSNSYDIGHVVGTGGGGLAFFGVVCNSQYKGDGVTGAGTPVNDAFYIDYVAHEIGHQFAANHTFNGTAGACADNRVIDAAYEVGSGSTIMSYAGLCGSQNLQNHSDAFFHTKSIDEINDYISTGFGKNCGSVTGAMNNTAIVDAGIDQTIPAQTPFMLIGSATDVDSDNLTFSWQQFDLGAATASNAEQVDD